MLVNGVPVVGFGCDIIFNLLYIPCFYFSITSQLVVIYH